MAIWRALGAGVLALVISATSAAAAELLMFRRAGCPYCATWDRVIGPIYPKTDIGRRLPIRFIDLAGETPKNLLLVHPVRFSPTFVLVDNDREIGRIEGYPGEDFFWGLLERLAERLPGRPSADLAAGTH